MINEIFEDRLAQFVFIFLIGIGIGTDLGNTVKHIKHPGVDKSYSFSGYRNGIVGQLGFIECLFT